MSLDISEQLPDTETGEPTAGSGTEIGLLTLLSIIMKKRALLMLRYPVNTLSQFVVLYVLFLVIFLGGQAVAGAALTDTLSGITVGYLFWMMAVAAYSGLAQNVTRESQWGTLEQLFMSPFGFGQVMAMKAIVNVLEAFLWGIAVLALILLTTGKSLFLNPLTVLPIGLLAVTPAVGIGFIFAGLALVYKRIETAFNLVQFVFIGLIAAPVNDYPMLQWLPLVQGSDMLNRAMADGVRLWEFPATELAVLIATAASYLLIGYIVFMHAQHRARHRGVMGHY